MEEKKTVGQKMKGHLKKHKGKYITGGVCLAVGVTAGIVYGNHVQSNLKLVNINIGKDNSIVNNITQITDVTRRGHAGKVIKCVETGETFASIRRAADLLGISKESIRSNLKGKTDSIKGMSFVEVGSFNADEPLAS